MEHTVESAHGWSVMSAEEARAIDKPEGFLGNLSALIEALQSRLKTDEVTLDRGFGNAIAIAGNLRLVDAKYAGIDPIDAKAFWEAYMEFSGKDLDFSFKVVTELLLGIDSRADDWKLDEMSEDLQDHCVAIIRKKLEKVRGLTEEEEYKSVMYVIQSILTRSDTEGEEMVIGELATPQRIIDELETMLTNRDREIAERAKDENAEVAFRRVREE